MRVYLVRHGQTAWNAERRNQGHTDIPLDAEGLEQARRLAGAFDNRPFSRILTSDLQRARSTAMPLAERYGIPLDERRELRERSFGEWEGQPMERIAQSFIEQELLSGLPREELRPPGGESLLDVWNRLATIAEEIEACHEPVVVIGHGVSSGLLLARFLRGTLATSQAFRFDNTGITTVARRPDGGYRLMQYNDSSHVREGAVEAAH